MGAKGVRATGQNLNTKRHSHGNVGVYSKNANVERHKDSLLCLRALILCNVQTPTHAGVHEELAS